VKAFKKINESHYAYITRIFSILVGPISVYFIYKYVNLETQGFISTFQSFLSLILIFELGLTQVLITFISHEKDEIRFNNQFLKGTLSKLNYIKEIFKFALKWYLGASLCLLFSSLIIGFLIFDSSSDNILWKFPWIIFVIFLSFNLFTFLFLSFMEGLGKLKDVYLLRFLYTVIFALSFWLFLYLDFNLWSLPLSYLISMIPYLFFIYKYRKTFSQLHRLNVKRLSNSFNWTKDLLPLQIKIAISALSSFFAISTMTPMTFVFYGAEEAGRMGLSLTILLAVIGLTTVLVSVNFHKFGVLASNKDIKAMDKLVFRLTLIVVILSILLIISILISFYFVESFFPDILTRLMPMSSFIYFAIGMIFSSLGAPMGAYLRAHKIDPIMKISLVSSIVVLISNYIALEYFSIQTLPIFYAIVVSSAFPFVVIFYFIHRRNYYKREINF
tara:strand:+ start:3427 stop:4758 length:1332 start_codon:yes stop_codon:yes gene_type:complete